MFARMGGERVSAASSSAVPLEAMLRDGVRGAPDVAALASREPGRLSVMAWHYHDDDVPGPEAAVSLSVRGLPADARQAILTHYRVDESHGNAYAAWKRMGSPIAPTRPQYDALEAASRLARLEDPRPVAVAEGSLTLDFTLPRQAISLVVIDWE
jgi:xylan 1,4-beta-xylosidase